MSDERLRAVEREARSTPDCPTPDALWSGARGSLAPAATRAIVLHTAACGACSEAWRVAVELARESGQVTAAARASTLRSFAPWALAAVAALAGVAFLATFDGPKRATPAQFRDEQKAEEEVRSLLPDRAMLPREACTLVWEAGPPGATYRVAVFSEDLRPIAQSAELDTPRYTVPAEALTSVPTGELIVWRVQTSLPNGSVLRSAAQLATIADAP